MDLRQHLIMSLLDPSHYSQEDARFFLDHAKSTAEEDRIVDHMLSSANMEAEKDAKYIIANVKSESAKEKAQMAIDEYDEVYKRRQK